jgi:hypothetical protein
MQLVEQALVNIIGVKPAYMRPPFLDTGGQVLPTMQSMGYRVVTNDIDAGDWAGLTVDDSIGRFTEAGTDGDGHIPLMHEVYNTTVETLVPWIIGWAVEAGMQLVTVGKFS